jgi:hypothetical protein
VVSEHTCREVSAFLPNVVRSAPCIFIGHRMDTAQVKDKRSVTE